MDKTCGTCGKCRNTHDGPYCYKGSSPRPVSTLRVMDCWVDPSEVEQAPVMTKVCSVCGRELPVSEFGRHSRTKDGYQPFCRQCHSEMNKGHRKRQPVEHNEPPKKAPELTPEQMGIGKGRRADHPTYVDKDTGVTMKWCRACKQYKPIDEFHRNKANKDGHEFDCKVCHNARVTAQHARKRAEKKAQKEQELQAAAHEAVEAVKKVLDEQPRVNAPAGGLRLPERLEKTVPKVVIEKGPSIGEKVQPITPLEKFETAEIVEELKRRGFRCIIWMEV
jgi:hypothetical protein